MNFTKIAGALLALLVVTGSAAALPGAANAHADENADDAQADDYANGNATDAADAADARDDESNESEQAESENDSARQGPPADAGPDGERGPPADLPEQVPDFVSEIHSLVGMHIAGDLDGNLGEQISDVTPDDGESEDSDSADSDSDDSESEDSDATDSDSDVDTDESDDSDDEQTEQ